MIIPIICIIFSIKQYPYLGPHFRGHTIKYIESRLLNKGFNAILFQSQLLIAQFCVYSLFITIATILLKLHILRNSLVEEKRISFVIFVRSLCYSDELRNDFYAR